MISLIELKKLIPMSKLDQLAIEYEVNKANQVKLPGQALFLCLLNGLVNHFMLTLRLLESQYALQTGQSCDHSAFGKRLANINPEFFHAILKHLRDSIGPKITRGDTQALRLRIVDPVTVTLSSNSCDSQYPISSKTSSLNNCKLFSSQISMPSLYILLICRKPNMHPI
jgi:hypothetical protein